MFKSFKTIGLSLLLSMLFVFVLTSSVFADDGSSIEPTPAATEATDGEVLPTEPEVEITPEPELTPSEPQADVTNEPLLTETPVVEETPQPTEEPVLPADENSVEEPIIVADETGDPLILGSTETEEILQGGDPWFMVGTQKYAWVFDPDGAGGASWQSACPTGTAAGSTCFEATSSNAINAALTYISDHHIVPTDKKIYVESGTYNETINIDGSANYYYGQLAGLIGVNGSATTTINGNVTIAKTKNGFTLSGFGINGGVTLSSNNGALTLKDLDIQNANGSGIILNNQAGAVTITDVESSENNDSGLLFSNIDLSTPYPLTITNSEFNNNDTDDDLDGAGAIIYNKGPVTVNGVSASGNSGDGMFIKSQGIVAVKNGVFSDNVEANTNSLELLGEGLLIHNQTNASAVTLENIQAHRNADTGVWVVTRGPVTAKNIVATHNIWQGMLVSNDFPNNGIYYPTTVSVSDSEFNMNGWHGLEIVAAGNITLSYVNANGNYASGVFINNCLWKDTACKGTGSVVILNPYQIPATYYRNGYNGAYDGLHIESAGVVNITGVSASGNTGNGVYVKNNFPGKIGGVTLNALPATDSFLPQSRFIYNGGNGLAIYSNGAVAINGTPTYTVRVDHNGSGGIVIGESSAPAGSSVLIKGVDLYNNSGDAIFIINKGAITLDTMWVNNPWGLEMYTSGFGFNLNNAAGTGGVTITNSAANYVGEYGFYILSRGAVSLKNVSTFRTGKAGMYINNVGATLPQPVTIIDGNVEQAHGTGIEIISKGTVTINGTNSFNNSGSHLPQNSIDLTGYASDVTWFDFYGAAGNTVSITMNYNGYANIQLINVSNNGEVIWSEGSGYWSDPFTSPTITLPQDGIYYIILDWDSDWHTDYNYLLNFRFNGTSSYSNTAGEYNGIYIDNSNGVGDVTIQSTAINSNPWVSNNSGNGIVILSNGNIKLLKNSLYHNKKAGVTLKNSTSLTPKSVTAGNLDIYDNGDDGLFINSIGVVILSNIASKENYASGILVDNCIYDPVLKKCKGAGAIVLNGTRNDLSFNGQYGAYFYTIGAVSINNLDSNFNDYSGVFITAPLPSDLAAKPVTGGVTLTTTGQFWNTTGDNGGFGWYVYTYGPVSLQNLEIYNSGLKGIYIDNSKAAAAKSVALTNVNVSQSGDTGIDIHSLGTVTLKGTSVANSYTKSVSIEYGQTVEGYAAGTLDFYFDVADGGNIDISFISDSFWGSVNLYDPNGYLFDNGYDNSVDFHASSVAGGTYRLSINPWDDGSFYYRISINDADPNTVENSYLTHVDGILIDNSGGTGDVILGKSATGGTIYSENNTGTGISINTRGNVNLSTAYVQNNRNNGISINSLTQAKSVTINDITVKDSGGYGLSVISSGPVVWTKGNIDFNGDYGVDINNSLAATPASVTLSKINIRDSRGSGLHIWSNGNVVLTDLCVIESMGDGIYVITKGGINLTRVKSMANSIGYGALLDNEESTGLYPPAVTIVDSDFNYNRNGLIIISKGNVTLQGVNVEGNYERGYHLNLGETVTSMLPGNHYEYFPGFGSILAGGEANWTFTVTTVDDDVAIYLIGEVGADLFDSNGNYINVDHWVGGVRHYILQPGEYRVSVYKYWSDGNGFYQFGIDADPTNAPAVSNSGGARINTNGNVMVARSTTRGNNNFNRNGGVGLDISANGSTTLSDVNTHGNLTMGLNILSSTAGKAVSLTRVMSADNRSQNVQVNAYGPVTWNSGGSYGSQYGATICNQNATTPGLPVTISNVDFNGAEKGSGLFIKSAGIVTLTKVGASWNGADGVMINNSYGPNSAVIVNNTAGGKFDSNGQNINGHGLSITSKGAVTLTNINASANYSDGLMVDTKGLVTITYTKEAWVNDNGAHGIWVNTLGAIKLTSTSKLHAENNYANGVYLSNSGATAPINVEGLTDKISQIRTENNGRGIDIYSNGVVTIRNAAAFYNAGSGFYIGDTTNRPSAVNMTNIIAQGNGNGNYPTGDCNGVTIFAKGPVNIFNLDTNQSAGNGLWVETTGAVTVKKVLTSWNGMRDAADNAYGIYIVTPSNVILDSIRSFADDNGVLVSTDAGSGTVTMLGTYFKNEIIDSGIINGYALAISSNGNVTLNRLDLRGNAGNIEVSSFAGKTTLKNVKAQNNITGIYVYGGTGADFFNVLSMNNGWYDTTGDGIPEANGTDGIYVDLYNGIASFTDSIFTGNTESGIEIYLGTPTATYKLLRTIYFGNDSDNVGGEKNLLVRN